MGKRIVVLLIAALLCGCSVQTDWEIPPVRIDGSIASAAGGPRSDAAVTVVEPYDKGEFQDLGDAGKTESFSAAHMMRKGVLLTDSKGAFSHNFGPILRKGTHWLIPPLKCAGCDTHTYLIVHVGPPKPITLSIRLTDDAIETKAYSPVSPFPWSYTVERAPGIGEEERKKQDVLVVRLRQLPP
jgi:hypothetical protein